ncbi:MAG: FAD:protein FMN transferase [Chloroflexota bacterium]
MDGLIAIKPEQTGGISRRKFLRNTGLFLVIMCGSFAFAGNLFKHLQKSEQTRSLMGTFASITVYATDKESGLDAINTAFSRINEIESRASIFNENAEAFRLNRDGYINNPSDDLLKLTAMSQNYYWQTGGYFDITVQPLLDLWGAGELWKESPEIQQEKINEAAGIIGSDKINITKDRLSFAAEGMKITLGAIAKGYAANEAVRVLESKGIEHALVDIGSDISILGSKPGGEPWHIVIINPEDTSQSLATLALSNKSITTSGNYQRYFTPDMKVHHIMNPKTDHSANECISATVITEDGALADTLATSIFAMGPKAGLEFVEALDNTECLLVNADRAIFKSSGLYDYSG